MISIRNIFLLATVWLFSLAQMYGQVKSFERSKVNPQEQLQQAEFLPKGKEKEALDLIEQALMAGLKNGDTKVQANSYRLLGKVHENLSQFDLSIANYKKAFTLFERENNHEGKLQCLLALGRVNESSGNLNEALLYFRKYVTENQSTIKNDNRKVVSKKSSQSSYKVKKPAPTGNTISDLDVAKLAISRILAKQNRFLESQKNLNTLDDNSYEEDAEYELNEQKAEVYKEMQFADSAIDYYKNNRDIAKKQNSPKKVAESNTKIALLLKDDNKEEEAIELLKGTTDIYRNLDDSLALGKELLALGSTELNRNKIASAKTHLTEANDIAQAISHQLLQESSLKQLIRLHEIIGNINESKEYYKTYTALLETQLETIKKQNGGKLPDVEITEQIKRIDLLEKNSEISNKTIEILRTNEEISEQTMRFQKALIGGLVFGLLLILIVGYLMYRNIQQKKIANQLLALKSLRSQMNPHFIFNALNSVNHYISQKDERSANKYLSEFSRLMRAVLEHSQKDFIPLTVEMEIMSLYLKLEHDRFSSKFEYTFIMDESLDLEQTLIPPMLIQPFVENAIWHGLRYKDEKGSLLVNYGISNNMLVVRIEDNGIGREQSKALKTENQKKNSSTGILNITKRIEIINQMFRSDVTLMIEDQSHTGGTIVTISLPIKTENE